MVGGALVFSVVSRIESSRDLGTLPRGEDEFDGEILAVKPLTDPDAGVEMVINLTDYKSRASDVPVLRVFGGDVTWVKDPDGF